MREKEERLEELLEETGNLNKQIEAEKRERCNLESELIELRKSVEGRVKRATVMHNLDLETLRSELERTRLQVKEAQEVGLAAYTDVFEEHDELLTALRTIPSSKRFFSSVFSVFLHKCSKHETRKMNKYVNYFIDGPRT